MCISLQSICYTLRRLHRRVREVYSSRGAAAVLIKGKAFSHRKCAQFYRKWVREVLPTVDHVSRNGIPTDQEIKLLDVYLPLPFVPNYIDAYRPTFQMPGYEDALSDGLRRHVQHGDKVVVVGGGWGVTGTIAANQAGSDGYVWIFEGSETMASHTRAALKMNGTEQNVEVRHSIVGEEISLKRVDSENTPSHLNPKELPKCNVLELDCEGAEIDILDEMKIHPRVVLVETHGIYGAETEYVKSLIKKRGYRIRRTEVADSSSKEFCIDNDIKVITAVRQQV